MSLNQLLVQTEPTPPGNNPQDVRHNIAVNSLLCNDVATNGWIDSSTGYKIDNAPVITFDPTKSQIALGSNDLVVDNPKTGSNVILLGKSSELKGDSDGDVLVIGETTSSGSGCFNVDIQFMASGLSTTTSATNSQVLSYDVTTGLVQRSNTLLQQVSMKTPIFSDLNILPVQDFKAPSFVTCNSRSGLIPFRINDDIKNGDLYVLTISNTSVPTPSIKYGYVQVYDTELNNSGQLAELEIFSIYMTNGSISISLVNSSNHVWNSGKILTILFSIIN